jgi:hypothetical protein
MEPSKEYLEEFKKMFKEKYDHEYTDEEAYSAAQSLLGFVGTLMEIAEDDIIKKRRLKKEPKGFHIEKQTYNCRVCGRAVTGDESWYDKWGAKCLPCQKAIEDGIVPGFVCDARDSFYLNWSLENKFGIKHQTARKLVRQGTLKTRIVLNADGKPYEYIFLKKENPHLIDPDRYSPARKSYDRHRNKLNKIYIKEKMEELRKELKNKRRKTKKII